MKVVHICASMTGGAGAAAFRLHQALRSSGIDSVMLTMYDDREELHVHSLKRPLLYRILGRLPYIGQRKYTAFFRKYEDETQALTFPDAVYDCSLDTIIQSADVINLHWVGNMLNYRKFFTNVRKPIVWTLHDMNPFMGALHFASDMEKLLGDEQALRLERKISEKKAQAYKNTLNLTIAPLCHWMKEESAASAAFAERPHILVKNCVDINVYNPQARERCKLSINLPIEKKILLYVSQHVNNPRKGSGILRAASTQLPQNCVLLVVGAGAIEGGDNIINVGLVNDASELAFLYASADALILPSIEDNLPNTMLEALCCGTPVLAFNQGGMKDVIEHGKNGLLSSEMTAAGLLSMINAYCANGVEWARESISEQAHARFSPKAVAGQYVEIYRQLLK